MQESIQYWTTRFSQCCHCSRENLAEFLLKKQIIHINSNLSRMYSLLSLRYHLHIVSTPDVELEWDLVKHSITKSTGDFKNEKIRMDVCRTTSGMSLTVSVAFCSCSFSSLSLWSPQYPIAVIRTEIKLNVVQTFCLRMIAF